MGFKLFFVLKLHLGLKLKMVNANYLHQSFTVLCFTWMIIAVAQCANTLDR